MEIAPSKEQFIKKNRAGQCVPNEEMMRQMLGFGSRSGHCKNKNKNKNIPPLRCEGDARTHLGPHRSCRAKSARTGKIFRSSLSCLYGRSGQSALGRRASPPCPVRMLLFGRLSVVLLDIGIPSISFESLRFSCRYPVQSVVNAVAYPRFLQRVFYAVFFPLFSDPPKNKG